MAGPFDHHGPHSQTPLLKAALIPHLFLLLSPNKV
ncbi:carboxypeptidase A1, isoform CRA_c [Rattus norvegicus]|uniref:Carboxypeptidase A1, isoform CRA_c n=1 Tax=Rattus norvegicus TaxID=10116 RepID=A6IEH3_RAT|nr:carboxypeptidase A1, isoform CRA_c [Rattus norvegicus]